MKNPVDMHIGRRLRRRRWLSGYSLQALADAVGVRFQQIEKYESGTNRISAARLWRLANALGVPVSFFYTGIGAAYDCDPVAADPMDHKETFELLRAYYGMDEAARRQLLVLIQAVSAESEPGTHQSALHERGVVGGVENQAARNPSVAR